ncbi:MAG: minor capsid protein [Deltaproteobacteria bacterium]|jgi:hypothetical protein|nr:minor capsid protein [Deltaproteobacteria bacterium]
METRFRWERGGGPGNPPRRLEVAHQALDTQVVRDTEPFVPMDTGALARSAALPSVKRKVGEIRYQTPYARRCYYGEGFNFRRLHHPQATHHWLEKAKAIYMPRWARAVAAILRGKGGRA